MRYTSAFISIIVALSTVAVAADPKKPDFSGTWELDTEKSEGVPPGMKQTMSVKQSGDRVDVETKVSGPQGERTINDLYSLDAKPTEFTPAIISGPKPKKGTRTSKWSTEGNGFDATEEATVESDEGGTDTLKGKRTWRLSADGKLLTVEMHLEGGPGPMKSTRVFVKK